MTTVVGFTYDSPGPWCFVPVTKNYFVLIRFFCVKKIKIMIKEKIKVK